MKKLTNISRLMVFAAALVASQSLFAQNFSESAEKWETSTLRAKGLDTTRLVRHSFLNVPMLKDTSALTYHEPMPDSLMPKTAIDLGEITIQAGTAEEVIQILEKQARAIGADWIISFNEPRMHRIGGGDFYYRSQAKLYKVINADLVAQSEILAINLSEQHFNNYASLITWVQNYVTHDGE